MTSKHILTLKVHLIDGIISRRSRLRMEITRSRRDVDCMLAKKLERNNFECTLVRRCEDHVGGHPVEM